MIKIWIHNAHFSRKLIEVSTQVKMNEEIVLFEKNHDHSTLQNEILTQKHTHKFWKQIKAKESSKHH